MLAGGPRSPSPSAAPTPGAVRLARGDQRTRLSERIDPCRVLRPRLDTRSHRGGPSWHGAFLPHASRASHRHRDSAASSSASSWAPSVAPPLSAYASREPPWPWRGVRQIPESAAPGDTIERNTSLSLAQREGPALSATPGAAPLSDSASRQPTGDGEAFDSYRIHEWRRARHLLTRPDTTLPPLPSLARRLSSWSQRPRRRFAAGLHGNPIEGVKAA